VGILLTSRARQLTPNFRQWLRVSVAEFYSSDTNIRLSLITVENRKAKLTSRQDVRSSVDWLTEVTKRFSDAHLAGREFATVNMASPFRLEKVDALTPGSIPMTLLIKLTVEEGGNQVYRSGMGRRREGGFR